MGPMKPDSNKQLIPLTVIPLSGAHSIAIRSNDIFYSTQKSSILTFS